ncbi:hypothetical protein QFC22_004132 [Naganishia vaughanmartiniae]|uniref:Uncharacterized protein n=1 Tax=Naganishia vaughanmartiniae TaxID=1424756 RepID=A0ACC2X2G5_9TREE|nr:hypothetical protein QFC22_004132 [Naganishia vaughanmartiniae]
MSSTVSTVTSADPYAYLKWPRLIIFTLNGALAVVATGLSAQSLVNVNADKKLLAHTIAGAKLYVGNVIAVTALMTAAAGVAALYTAALAVVTMFRIYRVETRATIRIREAIMAAMAIFLLVSAIIASVIIVPRSAGASAPGLPQALIIKLINATGKSVKYRDSFAFKALIVVWICFGTTVISFILAALTSRHIGKYGPQDTVVGSSVSKRESGAVTGEKQPVVEIKAQQSHIDSV